MTDFNISRVNSTNFSQELLISSESYVAVAFILFFIGFFGFSLNLSVIVFMWKQSQVMEGIKFENSLLSFFVFQLWTPLNVILFNLVVSDFLVSILGNPWTFISAVNQRWVFGKIGCVLYGFVMSLLGITSIITLTVLAFERYLMISRPFHDGINFRNAYCSIVFIWFYSFCLATPPLLGWGNYVNEAADISCSVNWHEKSTASTSYIMYLFILGLFVPLVVIIFSYANIFIRMKRNAFRIGRVTKAESRVANMILLMIAAFLVAWSPYAILALIIQFGDASFVTPETSVLPALLAKSSICYNPLIYIGLNVQFQQTWKQAHKSRNHKSSRENPTSSRFVSIEALVSTSGKPKNEKNKKKSCRCVEVTVV